VNSIGVRIDQSLAHIDVRLHCQGTVLKAILGWVMDTSTKGWINGFLGVLIFSMSLPATRVAVADFDPLFLTVARASIAAGLGLALLLIFRERRPASLHVLPLFVVAVGVVVGFPLLTALALQSITAAHSTVYIGLLPLATALFGVVRAGERPPLPFWIFSCIGSACVAGFALYQGGNGFAVGDLYMLGAIVVCGLGYAEGAKLSKVLGGWQVISWALVASLPLMAALMVWSWPSSLAGISWQAWIGLAYVSTFSMLIGFIFWYRGLAQGGIASVGQLQLLQPFMALGWAGLLLNEQVSALMLLVTGAVVACVVATRKFTQSAKQSSNVD
jgi:drug/metabolite transporter (DMT)-like permease